MNADTEQPNRVTPEPSAPSESIPSEVIPTGPVPTDVIPTDIITDESDPDGPGSLSHVPVLADEVIAALAPAPGKVFVDGTLGGAGHTGLLLAAGATVYGIDQDPFALERARAANHAGLHVLQGNYRDMVSLLAGAGVTQVDGILLDIGVSSFQLDDTGRGFSYHTEAPLDMRMSQSGESAADVVNGYDEEDIAAIIYEYGEDRLSRRIARGIVYAREKAPIETTVQLAEIVKRAYPGFSKGIHPARRTFQALRIHVNDELGALRDGLQAAETLLAPGGRLAVISFHSLEDRIVKRFLLGSEVLTPLTKRPVIASEAEQGLNPRARSAKLRSAERVGAA
ncbi:16S rRNA (cytosine(1402)-N(4))-methyltransferase RsmH [Deinococcus sp. RIT780]|uniref:16S rRNA (cytosine(1402)-N(4))-methyltransferase RsmH n=1 Tax=Deinococcus sp. RIT780 TaxID=2870472 RepID=UPI001C898A2F|nr:16S rRNA (cytosine(1402)-N(4))-methyltransferase RsmH [Deinococcus sp. RIT780]MBX8464802.1 16S rRNA (cytosine(1402)-N(4))-methyltransferase RsmH [Deinococcus sp. RIT780]